jgi:chromosome segregation ATPase
MCRAYEKEIEQMKDDFKDMRRDRDKFRDKFENIKEDFEEIKRQRDRYGQKFDRNNDFDGERHHTGRSSPPSKYHDDRHTTRPSEEPWKKDHR